MGKLKLCVVGIGRVFKSHLPAIRALEAKVELTAIVSNDPAKGQAEAKRLGVRYRTYDEALKDSGIHAVLLLLPHDLHAIFAIKAMQAGKHVLVEKPMALNRFEAAEMVKAANLHHVTLMIGQSRRFFQPVMESIRCLRNNEIGELINIHALLLAHMHRPAVDWWTDNKQIGGFIIPLWGSHILDYVLWAYGERPVSVYASGSSNNPHWEGEDEVAITLRFANGGMANILMSFNAGFVPDEEGLSGNRIWSTQDSVYERYIIGTKGMLHLQDEYELSKNAQSIIRQEERSANFTWQLEEFADAIAANRLPIASGSEVLAVVQTIDACYVSMSENRVVYLEEMMAEKDG